MFLRVFLSRQFFFLKRPIAHNRKMARTFVEERWLPKSALRRAEEVHDQLEAAAIGLKR